MNITLTMTEQEANALIQLLDVAVKAQGLQAASAALGFLSRIQESAAQAAKLAATPAPEQAP